MSDNPYESPHAAVTEPDPDAHRLVEVADAQRWLLLWILSGLVIASGMSTFEVTGWPFNITIAILAMIYLWRVRRLCAVLQRPSTIWLLGACIPILNIICIISLHNQANDLLRSHGIRIGLKQRQKHDTSPT